MTDWLRRGTDVLAGDLRYALLSLRRSPPVLMVIMGTLALGIGATSAVFGVIDRVYFEAPPGIRAPDQVRRLYATKVMPDGQPYLGEGFSIPLLTALQSGGAGLGQVAAYTIESARLADASDRPIVVSYTTSNYFETLRASLQRGRSYSDDENVFGDPRRLAVISDQLWRRQFGASSDILGRKFRIDSATVTVIGVAGPGFRGIDLDGVDVWLPIAAKPIGLEGIWWTGTGWKIARLIARLPENTSTVAFDAAATRVYHTVNESSAWFDERSTLASAPLLRARGPLHANIGHERGLGLAVRLQGATALLLLLSICNAASVVLLRAGYRHREMAIRLAVGATRTRLWRQALAEAVLLAGASCLAAVLVAWGLAAPLRNNLLINVHWTAPALSVRVLMVTASTSFLAVVAAALTPALLVDPSQVGNALKLDGLRPELGAGRFRTGILFCQSALCLCLFAASGMLLASLGHVLTVDMGFDQQNLLMIDISAAGQSVDVAALRSRLLALPGVLGVGASTGVIEGSGVVPVRAAGTTDSDQRTWPSRSVIDVQFPAAVGLRLVAGRQLDSSSSPQSVLINETMARIYWPHTSAVGQCFFVRQSDACMVVAGVVRDVRWNLGRPPRAGFYVSTRWDLASRPRYLYVRAAQSDVTRAAAAMVQLLETTLRENARAVRVMRVATLLDPQLRPLRIAALLFLTCGVLALVAAAIGVAGLVSYDIRRRARELAIRVTLGASWSRLVRDVLGPSMRVLAAGLAVGLGGAVVLGHTLGPLLLETRPFDAVAIGIAALLMLTVTVVASLVPAWRVRQTDPADALRAE